MNTSDKLETEKFKMIDHKTFFLEKFEPEIRSGSIKSICDMGSGESLNFLPLLDKYPELIYVGIEPSKAHAIKATQNISRFKNAKIYNSDGYSIPLGAEHIWGTFDLVISLSVLEHVKQLEKFIKNSIMAAKSGGRIVHRWDLGHALIPSSFKEALQVWLGNNFPAILPEHKFVSDLRPGKVIEILQKCGVDLESTTYHQMLNHKNFLRIFPQDDFRKESLARKIIEWEFEVSPFLSEIPETERLKLFPTVAVLANKK